MSNRIKILSELTLSLKEVHMINKFLGSTIWGHRIYFLSSFITSKDVNMRFWYQKSVIYGMDTSASIDVLYMVRKWMSIIYLYKYLYK